MVEPLASSAALLAGISRRTPRTVSTKFSRHWYYFLRLLLNERYLLSYFSISALFQQVVHREEVNHARCISHGRTKPALWSLHTNRRSRSFAHGRRQELLDGWKAYGKPQRLLVEWKACT